MLSTLHTLPNSCTEQDKKSRNSAGLEKARIVLHSKDSDDSVCYTTTVHPVRLVCDVRGVCVPVQTVQTVQTVALADMLSCTKTCERNETQI